VFLFGCLGVFGFPTYYCLWTYLFPQHYDSLVLRLLGACLFIPLLFAFRLQEKKWFELYFYFTIFYAFPFFFMFMFFMNEASQTWSQSMVLMLAVLFQFDIRYALAALLIGSVLAYLSYLLVTGQGWVSRLGLSLDDPHGEHPNYFVLGNDIVHHEAWA
jgi:two-component system, CAI-1 autoinducer sensor kinase/phosphatase CqsS